MSDFYDDLETLDPAAREAALFAALPRHIAHAKANTPYFNKRLAAVDPIFLLRNRQSGRVTRRAGNFQRFGTANERTDGQ